MNTQDDNINAKELTTPAPTPITRAALIEKMVEQRGADWDHSDTEDMLVHGRIGFVEMPNEELEEIANEAYCMMEDGVEVRYKITDPCPITTTPEEITRELLAQLIEAQGMLGYHMPEKFDDAIHEANWTAKMNAIQAAIVKAKGRG